VVLIAAPPGQLNERRRPAPGQSGNAARAAPSRSTSLSVLPCFTGRGVLMNIRPSLFDNRFDQTCTTCLSVIEGRGKKSACVQMFQRSPCVSGVKKSSCQRAKRETGRRTGPPRWITFELTCSWGAN